MDYVPTARDQQRYFAFLVDTLAIGVAFCEGLLTPAEMKALQVRTSNFMLATARAYNVIQ